MTSTAAQEDGEEGMREEGKIVNPSIPIGKMFASGPEELKAKWFRDSVRFKKGIERIGGLLTGGRALGPR